MKPKNKVFSHRRSRIAVYIHILVLRTTNVLCFCLKITKTVIKVVEDELSSCGVIDKVLLGVCRTFF